ncbi:hypothetical protein [Rhodoferax sp. GW822-FHT02A01]|uniref:hypothetical protein n=1 Tax=Rhodoferax sp. GW822-FHT02A01 TaxID=3141537 RepID=UPI00315D0ACC
MANFDTLSDDPQFQIGMGMLAAAAPRADAAGFGQRLFDGVNYAQGMRRSGLQQKLLDAQLQGNQMQLQTLKAWQNMWAPRGGQQLPQQSPPGGGLLSSAPGQSPDMNSPEVNAQMADSLNAAGYSGDPAMQGFSKGGMITPEKVVAPRNDGSKDNAFVSAKTGEFVMSKEAVKKYGKNFLQEINSLRFQKRG